MKKMIILLFLLFSLGIVKSQTISVSGFSLAFTYRQLYPDGKFVKNSTFPNYDIRWKVEIFPEKAWRLSVQPGVISRLYSLHDAMYDNSFTSKRFICPAISVNIEKHFNNSDEKSKWGLYGGVTVTNLYENGVEWRSFKWLDFKPYSYYLQIGGIYRINKKISGYVQFNYPWIRNLNYLPVNVGLGSGNTPGAFLSTPTLGNERWSITAGVQFGFGKKKKNGE